MVFRIFRTTRQLLFQKNKQNKLPLKLYEIEINGYFFLSNEAGLKKHHKSWYYFITIFLHRHICHICHILQLTMLKMTKIPFLSSSLVENCSLKDAVRFSAVKKKNAIHWTRILVALLTLQCRISTLQFCESSEEYIAVPCSVIKGRQKVVQ